jgi:hypothetical protein
MLKSDYLICNNRSLMATPAWLAMTATGWVPALHLPDFSQAVIEIFAAFLVTG